jgi:hypothetical protein
MQKKFNPKLLELAQKVKAKRPRIVIDHIIKHGSITTEDLKNTYGYDHPPRCVADVKDQGIPLVATKVVSGTTGRKIASYTFGDPDAIVDGKLGGRRVLPKKLKKELVEETGSICAISCEKYDESHLQIDHRVPFRVAGDHHESALDSSDYMLLSGSAQRQKSWACEHCPNLLGAKSLEVCRTCYWASPENYTHIATEQERRVDLVFAREEVAIYEAIKNKAALTGESIQAVIKKKISS